MKKNVRLVLSLSLSLFLSFSRFLSLSLLSLIVSIDLAHTHYDMRYSVAHVMRVANCAHFALN